MKIIKLMSGANVESWSFKRNMTVNAMTIKADMPIGGGDTVRIDQQLFFLRLFTAPGRALSADIQPFDYELCSFPQLYLTPKTVYIIQVSQ